MMRRLPARSGLCLLLMFAVGVSTAAEKDGAKTESTGVSSAEIQELKKLLLDQQRQIDELRRALKAQDNNAAPADTPPPAPTPNFKRLGQVGSTAPMIPPAPPEPGLPNAAANAPEKTSTQSNALPSGARAPLQLDLGNITIQPIGFMDATFVWRNTNAGSGIGSNFGNIPYSNTSAAKLSESRFSIQNSRLGFRVDGDWKGAHFIGYNEFDFLGTSGANNIGITNGSFVPRIRLYWVDMQKSKFELLAGQSWSLLTPNRTGLSPLPGDVFYSQVMDVNYLIGLTWTRQTGVRFVYHPNPKVAMGVSFENPNQYMGGYGGGPQITLPAGLAAVGGAQLDNGTASFLSTPNLHPDIIAKVAFDPSRRVHFEVAGIERDFKIVNPTTLQPYTKTGAGGSINGNFEVIKHLRLISNNFYSDGGGRYLFGNAPDLIVRPDGNLSPIHSSGLNEGFEAQVTPNTLLWAYYGAIFIQKNVTIDTNGKPVGYGYDGSSNAQNRNVQEGTFGITQTFWKDARYGALSFIGQYEYLSRRPWYLATGTPSSAHDHTVYLDLRYTLPGAAPSSK